jgi:hypothetical protein
MMVMMMEERGKEFVYGLVIPGEENGLLEGTGTSEGRTGRMLLFFYETPPRAASFMHCLTSARASDAKSTPCSHSQRLQHRTKTRRAVAKTTPFPWHHEVPDQAKTQKKRCPPTFNPIKDMLMRIPLYRQPMKCHPPSALDSFLVDDSAHLVSS